MESPSINQPLEKGIRAAHLFTSLERQLNTADAMQKPTEYKLEDSNVENIGSIMDKAARMSAALTEPCWEGAGEKPGIEIWRVHNERTEQDNPNFGVERVPSSEYRKFYRGDSYILLYTYVEPESTSFSYNVHFWIGSSSSADEYGVAAYKTVELDDLLGGAPVQYREMEGYESELFLSYFAADGPCPGSITLLEGGYDSGFRHVTVEEYQPRLLWVRQENKQMLSSELTCSLSSLNKGDCFILDSGSELYIYRGEESSPFEKNKAIEIANTMEEERAGKSRVVDGEDDENFWALLGGAVGAEVSPSQDRNAQKTRALVPPVMDLYSMNDVTLQFDKVASGPFTPQQLRDDDVMLINLGSKIFVSVGEKAPVKEKAAAMMTAQAFLTSQGLPMQTPICRVLAGQQLNDPVWKGCFESSAMIAQGAKEQATDALKQNLEAPKAQCGCVIC